MIYFQIHTYKIDTQHNIYKNLSSLKVNFKTLITWAYFMSKAFFAREQ